MIRTIPLLVLLLLTACDPDVKNLDVVDVGEPDVASFKKKQALVLWSVSVHNPNPFDVLVTEVQADVFIEGERAATIVDRTERGVSAGDTTDLPLDISVDPRTIWPDLQTGAIRVREDVVATLKVKGFVGYTAGGEAREEDFRGTRTALFTNSDDLELTEDGDVVEEERKGLFQRWREKRQEKKEKRDAP